MCAGVEQTAHNSRRRSLLDVPSFTVSACEPPGIPSRAQLYGGDWGSTACAPWGVPPSSGPCRRLSHEAEPRCSPHA